MTSRADQIQRLSRAGLALQGRKKMKALAQISFEDILTDALESVVGDGGRAAEAQAVNNDMQALLSELSRKLYKTR